MRKIISEPYKVYKVEWKRFLPSNIFANSQQNGIDYFIAKDKFEAKRLANIRFDLAFVCKITKLSNKQVTKLEGALGYNKESRNVEWVDFDEED